MKTIQQTLCAALLALACGSASAAGLSFEESGLGQLYLGSQAYLDKIKMQTDQYRIDNERRAREAAPITTPNTDTTGTGFAILKNHFITNAHVVENCTTIKVGGLPARLRAIDRNKDLAILISPNNGTVAKIFSGRVRQGDVITVVGFPLNGILATGAQVTAGNVSALAGVGNDTRFIQITAPVQPGNSGGPLVDTSGNVVGVVVSKLDALNLAKITGDIPQNVNFAISPLVLQSFLGANGVDYQTAPSTKNLSTADVSEIAKKYTSLVECYK